MSACDAHLQVWETSEPSLQALLRWDGVQPVARAQRPVWFGACACLPRDQLRDRDRAGVRHPCVQAAW